VWDLKRTNKRSAAGGRKRQRSTDTNTIVGIDVPSIKIIPNEYET
jgi:hypothetical protein